MVNRLEQAARHASDRELLADCYFMMGDVHFFNDAPRAAIRAYKRSHHVDPEHECPLYEIASQYSLMGRYEEAIRFLKRVLAICPDDEIALTEIDRAQRDMRQASPPAHREGDALWDSAELLARSMPKAALRRLARKRSVGARKLRAYAALSDAEGVLHEWHGIERTSGPIETEYVDWFYLEDVVWDDVRFWRSLQHCAARLRFGVWAFHRAEYRRLPEELLTDGSVLRSRARVRLVLRYHIARTSGDLGRIRSLAARYPDWPEAAELLRKATRRQRA